MCMLFFAYYFVTNDTQLVISCLSLTVNDKYFIMLLHWTIEYYLLFSFSCIFTLEYEDFMVLKIEWAIT